MFSLASEFRASPVEAVLGDAFSTLHPTLQRYFRRLPVGACGVGCGVFEEAGLRVRALRPLFAILAVRGIAASEVGSRVPFQVRNVDHPDGSRTAERDFRFARRPRTMVDEMRAVDGRVVDRIGRRGEVEVELDVAVVAGGLTMTSLRIALRIGRVRIPVPPVVRIRLAESIVDDLQHVAVCVRMPVLGEVYGYRGTVTNAVPGPGHSQVYSM